jgi:hypothetical protein
MKMALYDGNVMRVSALERVKARMGRWKRGSSGKMKWKSGSSQARNELRVALTVNKEAYEIQPHQIGQMGPFAVSMTQAEGRIILTASTGGNINGPDVLQVLHLAYDQLKPRETLAKA